MALSSFARDELNDALLGNGTYNSTAIHVALFTADPGLTGVGVEAADGNYARVQATGGNAFGASSGGTASNGGAITFASGTGWAGSETLTHCGLFDAATAGNFLIGGALDSTVNVTVGAEVEFATGNLDVTMS